jgi:carnosine N-methyltransferase
MSAGNSSDLNHSGGQHSLPFAYEAHLQQDANEQTHWNDVCRAYRQYSAFVIQQYGLNFPHRLANFPAPQQSLLPLYLQYGTLEFQQRLTLYKDAAIRNQFCLDCILRHAGQPISQGAINNRDYATESQISKVASVLKSLARDWSVEGAEERNMAYAPILESVQKYCPLGEGSRSSRPKICVPGAGVGRLALELAARGYAVQGNEFSLFMLLASDFILNGPVVSVSSCLLDRDENGSPRRHPLSISPWLLETRNVHCMADPFRTVQIPDVDPYDMITSTSCEKSVKLPVSTGQVVTTECVNTSPPMSRDSVRGKADDVDFSMAAGDFSFIYSASSELCAWDVVVACFFLDASPNVIEYLQVVYNMLKPGGILISFGPLHWHWTGPSMLQSDQSFSEYHARFDHLDPKFLQSYDFCWEDIKTILINIGFEMVEQKVGVPARYTADLSSMLVSEYRCVHFVARKTVQLS